MLGQVPPRTPEPIPAEVGSGTEAGEVVAIPTAYAWVFVLRQSFRRCGDVQRVHHTIDWESVRPTIDEVRDYADEWHTGEGFVAQIVGELRSVWTRAVEAEVIEPKVETLF
jgi:hypothetical protein